MLPRWHRGQLCFQGPPRRWACICVGSHSAASTGPRGRIKQPHCAGLMGSRDNRRFGMYMTPCSRPFSGAREGPLIESTACVIKRISYCRAWGPAPLAQPATWRHAEGTKARAGHEPACPQNPLRRGTQPAGPRPRCLSRLHAGLGLLADAQQPWVQGRGRQLKCGLVPPGRCAWPAACPFFPCPGGQKLNNAFWAHTPRVCGCSALPGAGQSHQRGDSPRAVRNCLPQYCLLPAGCIGRQRGKGSVQAGV